MIKNYSQMATEELEKLRVAYEQIITNKRNMTVNNLLVKSMQLDGLRTTELSMTANGVCYDRSIRGFIPDIVNRIYNERSLFKKKMLKLEQDNELIKKELQSRGLNV